MLFPVHGLRKGKATHGPRCDQTQESARETAVRRRPVRALSRIIMDRVIASRPWTVLCGLTLTVTLVMRIAGIPGALMLGPMMSGVVVAFHRPGLVLPRWSPMFAQTVLGTLVAGALSPDILAMLLPRWPLVLGMNLLVIGGMFLLGLLATYRRWFPGTAGLWGLSPGGASAMVLLSDSHGGDRRLVALFHYLRLVFAMMAVISLGLVFGTPRAGDPGLALPGAAGTPWLAPVDPVGVAIVAAIIALSMLIAWRLGAAMLAIFVAMISGIAVQASGLVALDVPPFLSAAAFCIAGWYVGLGFSRQAIAASVRYVPRMLICIALAILLCAVLALLLARMAGVDYLTAYMALNPGGLDVVVLTAASVETDLSLIISIQVARLVLVVAIAPLLGRVAARWFRPDA